MPLAIDYHGFDPSKDKIDRGRFLDGWFSLLARLYDRKRDEIEQRERSRRTRMQRIWASATVTLIAVLTVLTLYAFQQKNEVQRQARVSQANYLAAESRVQVEGDARLSFLLAKHSRQIVSSPAARQNLLAAFYRNSFGLVGSIGRFNELDDVYSSPFC